MRTRYIVCLRRTANAKRRRAPQGLARDGYYSRTANVKAGAISTATVQAKQNRGQVGMCAIETEARALLRGVLPPRGRNHTQGAFPGRWMEDEGTFLSCCQPVRRSGNKPLRSLSGALRSPLKLSAAVHSCFPAFAFFICPPTTAASFSCRVHCGLCCEVLSVSFAFLLVFHKQQQPFILFFVAKCL